MEELQPGMPLGAFHRLGEPIGSGAMGEVWTAFREGQDEPRAAKILRPEHGRDPKLVERFITERSLLLTLEHPGIVPVLDMVMDGDRLAIIMEFQSGGSLRELLERRKTLAPREALTACAEILEALAYAHHAGITHRDVKPDNVLLSSPPESSLSGLIKVTDFGIASLLDSERRQSTGIIGTPQYLSPESITTGATVTASDIYGTGIMLYELLAGRTPFSAPGTDFAVAYRHVTSKPPRLDVPAPFWAVMELLLSKNPNERPTATEAAGQLRRLAKKYRDLEALKPLPAPVDFDEAERPATALRGISGSTTSSRKEDGEATAAVDSPEQPSPSEPLPDLGEASHQTMVRSFRRPVAEAPAVEEEAPSRWPAWLTRQVLWFSGATLALVVAVVAFLVWGPDMNANTAKDPFSAQGQAQSALPTGLGIQRSVEYQPSTGTAKLTITYSAQKADLSGDFLEVIPSPEGTSGCPNVTWERVNAHRNEPSVTGLDAECGWDLSGLKVPANGSVEATASVKADLDDKEELEKWLASVQEKTQAASTDAQSHSTSYPAQRITNIKVTAPNRAASRTVLPVSVLPVWPSGADELNPLFTSPRRGEPSSMLKAISSAKTPLRFVDGCSGNTVVSKDGMTVTAVSVSPQCTVNAEVGNFSTVESNQFSIVARK